MAATRTSWSKLRLQPTRDHQTVIVAINAVGAEMKTAFDEVRWSFFEPDDRD